jgi:hypothetical protein
LHYRYLILHLNRFTKNNFYVEKNPTIVTFPGAPFPPRSHFNISLQDLTSISPFKISLQYLNFLIAVKNLELKDYVDSPPPPATASATATIGNKLEDALSTKKPEDVPGRPIIVMNFMSLLSGTCFSMFR